MTDLDARRFRAVFNSNLVGMFLAVGDGIVRQPNDAFLQLIGMKAEDFSQRDIRWQDITPPEQLLRDKQAELEFAETGRVMPFEKMFMRPDGTRVPVLVSATIVSKDPFETVVFVIDIIHRKKAEQEREVQARLKEELVTVVSHDLKSPLGNILLNTEVLQEEILNASEKVAAGAGSEVSWAESFRSIERIRRTVERMSRLIVDLLDMSRIDAGRLVLDRRPLSMVVLAREGSEATEAVARVKDVKLELDSSDPAWSGAVLGDRDRLLQILTNVFANAIEFSPRGGTVRIQPHIDGGKLEVTVQDRGPGVPAEQLPHLFDRFFLNRPNSRKSSGVGLSVVKGLVELHGGSVRAQSQPGAGCGLTFSVPLASVPAEKDGGRLA